MTESASYATAGDLITGFSEGSLSPVDVVTATIARVEAVEPRINAVAERLYDDANRQALIAEERYRNGTARPLEGVPVALKEEQPIAGRTMTDGSQLLRDHIAPQTHPIIERIVAAGAITIVRTTTPEFCAAVFTHGELWGITRNPWHLDYSPGGSSGGSAAALASGMTPLATGSDIGGSIRVPAAFSGVVGFRPPFGRVPAMPPYNQDRYCQDGPLARTVADCARLSNVIAGRHPDDPVSVPNPTPLPAEFGDVAGLRVAVSWDLGGYTVAPDVLANTRACVDALAAAGALVEEVDLAWDRRAIMRAAWAHYGAIFAPSIRQEMARTGREDVTTYVRDFLARAEPAFARDGVLTGLDIEARIHADLAAVFRDFDVLVCPTSGTAALLAGEDYHAGPFVIDDVVFDVEHSLEIPLAIPFNIASRCPVLAVPSGIAASGVPTGVQVVARPYDDATAFRVGAAIEAQHPWYRHPDWMPRL